MGYGSHAVNKLDYARFLAASLCYLANVQRDAAGLIVFDEDVTNYVAPSTRQGQLFRLLHAIEQAQAGTRTDFTKPFVHFQNFLHRRGIVVVISDFYEDPAVIVKTVEPLRFRGNEVILFHLLDPAGDRAQISRAGAAGGYGKRRRGAGSFAGIRQPRIQSQDRRAY